MSRQAKLRWVLGVGLGSVFLSGIGGLISCLWLVIAGALTAGVALVGQHRLHGPVAIPFKKEDWIPHEEGWALEIPKSRHGRGAAQAVVYQRRADGLLEEIMCGNYVTAEGVTVITISRHADGVEARFDGEVRFA